MLCSLRCDPCLVLLVASLTGACSPAVEASVGTEGSTTGDVGTSTTGPAPSTSGPADSTATVGSTTTGDETSDAASDETSDEDSAGFIPRTDVGDVPAGACLGRSPAGVLATIHGSDGDPLDLVCETTPAPCESDIVGTWTVQEHCGFDSLPNFFEHECPESTMVLVNSGVQGTRTFNEDMTFEMQTTLVLDIEVTLDAEACFGTDCETFGELIDQDDNNLAATCGIPEGSDSCVCAMTIANDQSGQGTYELTDDGLVLTSGGNDSDPSPVCASDGHLTVWDTLHESQLFQEVPCDEPADCVDALGDLFEEWFCV